MSYSCYEYVGICPSCGEACKIESSSVSGASHDVCSKCHHVFNQKQWWQDDGMEMPTEEQVLRYLEDCKFMLTSEKRIGDPPDETMEFWNKVKQIVNG